MAWLTICRLSTSSTRTARSPAAGRSSGPMAKRVSAPASQSQPLPLVPFKKKIVGGAHLVVVFHLKSLTFPSPRRARSPDRGEVRAHHHRGQDHASRRGERAAADLQGRRWAVPPAVRREVRVVRVVTPGGCLASDWLRGAHTRACYAKLRAPTLWKIVSRRAALTRNNTLRWHATGTRHESSAALVSPHTPRTQAVI